MLRNLNVINSPIGLPIRHFFRCTSVNTIPGCRASSSAKLTSKEGISSTVFTFFLEGIGKFTGTGQRRGISKHQILYGPALRDCHSMELC